MNNIVIFGPVHSGKTTLAGFIRTYYMSESEFKREEELLKEKLEEKNILYKMSDRFTYFISMDEDELIRDSKNNLIGTTKRIHMKHIPHKNEYADIDITYIETPGLNTRSTWKQKYQGIFIGEIGIFVIDINEILKLILLEENSKKYNSKFDELFASLFLWCSFKEKDKLIIAISKTENVCFADIRCAVSMIKSIKQFENISILPIGIEISERKGYNIFDSTNCLKRVKNNYKPLIDEIIRLTEVNNMKSKKITKFAFINLEEFEKNKKELQIKVLDGKFYKNDKVKIYPTPISNDGERYEVHMSIKDIKDIDNNLVDLIEPGNIVTIIPKKVSYKSKPTSLKDLKIAQSSFLLGENTKYKKGNFLLFKTRKTDKNTFQRKYMSLMPKQHIKIIWFGKLIELEILCRYPEGDYYYMGAIVIEDDIVIMPLNKHGDENYLPYKNFSLEIDNSYFFDAQLDSIKFFKLDSSAEYDFYFSIENRYFQTVKDEFKRQGITLEDNNECFYRKTTYKNMYECFSVISNILKKYDINNYDLRLYSN